ncbi:MAG: hypothetical protein ACI841_003973 [Planctomycetota bacterium]|jgi:hypothetical protein
MNLLLLHAAVTWALIGLIWTIQLVQYPGFALVGANEFPAYHEHHCARITWIVAPLMAVELATGLALHWDRPAGLSGAMIGTGLALIAVNWAWTAFVSVPLHRRLSGRVLQVQAKLVATNWVRTVVWSARGAWALFALRTALGQP